MRALRVIGPLGIGIVLACGSSSPAGGGNGSGSSSSSSSGSASSSGSGSRSGSGSSSGSASSSGSSSGGTPSSKAAALAIKLRGDAHFLVGMGNDLASNHDQDGAYTLGPTLDLHYAYLVGLEGQGGWPDWNTGGTFVDLLADSAKKKGVTPMYTLYSMAANGDGDTSHVTDDTFMKAYWDGAKLLFQRVGGLGVPAVVHLEPDWWGYAQQFSPDGTKPVHVTALAPDCAALTDDFKGLAGCLLLLARKYAPNAVVGFHASNWAAPTPQEVVAYFKTIGADKADFVATDVLDRDAGCFEAHTDPNCQRGGTFYWDETNKTSPNFHENFAWVKAVTDGLGLPMMWWQIPFGVPSATPGGTAGHYRDDRVHYLFAHFDEAIAAGGFAFAFGTGAANQTYIDSDGDQFKNAVTSYFASPVKLP